MNNLFGTDGIRAQVGSSPLTLHELKLIAQAITTWFKKYFSLDMSLAIGCDTRISKDVIKQMLAAYIAAEHINILDLDILPSPALYIITRDEPNIAASIMITASHNDYTYNGIKIFTKKGKLTDQHEQEITRFFYQGNTTSSFSYNSCASIHKAQLFDVYLQHLKTHFSKLNLYNKKIVFDCAHGAISDHIKNFFQHLNATIVCLNNSPNGRNINQACGAIDPYSLCNKVVELKADIGFAFDGDADRVIACNHLGELKSGDHILTLLAQHTRYHHQSTLVATTMSNSGLEQFLRLRNKQLIRTEVGDKHVLNMLKKHNLTLGGEDSGHIIMTDLATTGDGLATALSVLQVAHQTNNWQLNTFNPTPQINGSLNVSKKKNLTIPPLSDIITKHKKQLISGRLLIRYSGTENVLRVMVEQHNKLHAQKIYNSLIHQLKQALIT